MFCYGHSVARPLEAISDWQIYCESSVFHLEKSIYLTKRTGKNKILPRWNDLFWKFFLFLEWIWAAEFNNNLLNLHLQLIIVRWEKDLEEQGKLLKEKNPIAVS